MAIITLDMSTVFWPVYQVKLNNVCAKYLHESILPNFFSLKTKIFSRFFAIKLGHFEVQSIFSYFTNTQAKQWKSDAEEKRSLVGLAPGLK